MLKRSIVVPWIGGTLVMYLLSYIWHGVALRDLQELRVPLTLYLILAGVVYLLISLAITLAVHKAIQHDWISLKKAFPFMAMLIGAAVGFAVYLLIFVLGMSFADHGVMHALVDVVWQMFEQGLGGLAVSLGIIYDMRQQFLEHERAN